MGGGSHLPAASRSAAQAAPATVLDTYLSDLRTLRAEFSQVVTDGTGRRGAARQRQLRDSASRENFAGSSRPRGGAQSPQLMVADGKNLWFYDRDLEQVSVKAADAALTATPASLLSGDGKPDEYFTVQRGWQARRAGVGQGDTQRSDADFREAQLAFRKGRQRTLTHGAEGQARPDGAARLQCSTRNAPVAESEVQFTPPAGADVIGTPVP